MTRILFPTVATVLIVLAAPAPAAGPDFSRDVHPVLAKHCFKCHGDQKRPRAGLSLSKFQNDTEARADRETWQAVLDSVRGMEMPPENEPQPTAAEREALLGWLTGDSPGWSTTTPSATCSACPPICSCSRTGCRSKRNTSIHL